MRPVYASLALVVVGLLAVPGVAADHPGSNMGLARFESEHLQNMVHRLTDVDADFAGWEQTYPELVDRYEIGQTSSGFPLYAIRVTDESVGFEEADLSTGHKLRVYLDGGHHGNEYLGVELVMYYLEQLLDEADAGNEETLAFLHDVEIHAVPIINVDGNTLDTRKNSNQVDPNRNYDFQFGGPGSGDLITDLNYRGPSAHSEAEVRANADFGAELHPDLWITMHTGVAEFYWPWGWTHDPTPDDAFFTSLEKPFEDATNGRVDAMQAAALYLAAGATDDYGYGALGIPTFTYEVHEDQFIPVYGEPIGEVIADQLAGLDFMVKNVRHMGAWVEPAFEGDDLVLRNEGWGVATNITVWLDGKGIDVDDLSRNVQVRVPAAHATQAVVEYPVLQIDTSGTRTHTLARHVSSVGDVERAPTVGAVALLALVGLALATLRRR